MKLLLKLTLMTTPEAAHRLIGLRATACKIHDQCTDLTVMFCTQTWRRNKPVFVKTGGKESTEAVKVYFRMQ